MPRGRPKKASVSKPNNEYKNIILAIIFLFFGAITILSDTQSVFGYFLFNNLSKIFGEYYMFIFSPVLILIAVFLFKEKNYHFNLYRIVGLLMFFSSVTTIIGFFISYNAYFNFFPILESILGKNAVFFSFFLLFVLSLVILFRFSPVGFTKKVISYGGNIKDLKKTIKGEMGESPVSQREKRVDKKKHEFAQVLEQLKKEKEELKGLKKKKQMTINDAPKKINIEKKSKFSGLLTRDKEKPTEIIKAVTTDGKFSNWQFPSLSLLNDIDGSIKIKPSEIRTKEIEIQEKLLQFKIEVSMEGYMVGPTVIQYRLKPKEGVKLQKIESLKKDLTLALHAKSIRIQAPIPGLGVVGIEVPNNKRQNVGLKEILTSKEFNKRDIAIPLAIGKDVSGRPVVGDLTKMPHILIAGQTASGKSVGMNGFLISLLYRFSPSELKIIMVDPKRVELSVYNGIPHLLTPVITNSDKALNALKWCIAEMLRRYELEAKVNARSIKEYNAKVSKSEKLPYIVMVIDELADLMMSGNKKEVEGTITRIAQMARAVGMHLIIATQRPSVDVITGLIKANIPSRIAFTVASQVDSRTVIDKGGAEDLLGRGDMLYYPTGVLEPERVQGVLVETPEVEAVVNKLKLTVDPDMLNNMQDDSIVNGKSKLEGSIMEGYKGEQEEEPEVIEKAIKVVKDSQKGSTSLIQRKLGLGYARAAKVLDILEELGVVGPSNGSKPREVYVESE